VEELKINVVICHIRERLFSNKESAFTLII
jgi:hypothetical protein